MTNPMTRPAKSRPPADIEVTRKGDLGTQMVGGRGSFTSLGYRSAEQLRRNGSWAMPGSEDWHMANDRGPLVNQSRQFYRDMGLYRGMIDRAVTNAIRGGFSHQARTGSKAWNRAMEHLWHEEFEPVPEVRGLWSFGQCQQIALREGLVAGDMGAILVGGDGTNGKPVDGSGRIEILDSDRITGNDGKWPGNGVKVDALGRPVTFYISQYGSMGQVEQGTARPIDAKDFVWMPFLDRPSQTRGMPVCQASFAMLHRINDVCDSEALAWQILARLAVAIYREDAVTAAYDTSIADPDKTAESDTGELATRLHVMDEVLIFHGKPGEKITGIERNIPGQNFPDAIRMFMRLMGLPIGIPLELSLMDYSQTNYSSLRGALEQAFSGFENMQRLLEWCFCRRVRNWKVDQWIAEGKLTDRPDKHLHEWIKPQFPWLDLLKEAQGWGAMLDRSLTTHAHAIMSARGVDREEQMEAREAEVEDALQRAERLEKAHPGTVVPWEIFAGLKPASASGGADNEPAEPRRPEDQPREPREPEE